MMLLRWRERARVMRAYRSPFLPPLGAVGFMVGHEPHVEGRAFRPLGISPRVHGAHFENAIGNHEVRVTQEANTLRHPDGYGDQLWGQEPTVVLPSVGDDPLPRV